VKVVKANNLVGSDFTSHPKSWLITFSGPFGILKDK
jgi:hypothetical protein